MMISKATAEEIDLSSLPKLLGTSNAGTEFYFMFIPAWEEPTSNDLQIYIYSNMNGLVFLSILLKPFLSI